MLDYLILSGLNVAGVAIIMLVLFVIYRRGIALRLGFLMLLCVVVVDHIAFFLGREGMTSGRNIIALTVAVLFVMPLLILIFRQTVNPVRLVTQYLDRLAQGEIPPKITTRYYAEFHENKENLNQLIDVVNRLQQELNDVTTAARQGNLRLRADTTPFRGNWQQLVVGINTLIDAFSKPITVTAEYIEQLSQSEIPEQITEEYQGDFNAIKTNLNRLGHDIRRVLDEIERLSLAIQAGKLSTRGNVEAFGGGWRDVVGGMNSVIDTFMPQFEQTADYVARISQGDIPELITDEYHGDFNTLKNHLNQCIQAINGLIAETVKLTEAATEGKLDIRGDAERFKGNYACIVQGVNNTLDAVITPLNVTADYVDRIARGDIPPVISDTYYGKFHELTQNVNSLIQAMQGVTGLAQEMASGNLDLEVYERSEQDRLMRALNQMLQRLHGVVLDVKHSADNVASGSQAMSASAEEMSQGASEQASSAEEVSSSMEQMAANVQQNADNARQTETIALQASHDACESGEAVTKTVNAMHEIVKKISVIEEIARQTHILSLNATIEAARFQEKGKSFGVVAAEVRSLATRTHTAATEINEVAAASITIAERAGRMLTKLVPAIQRTAELVQEISAASDEQHSGAKQINKAIQQLDQVIQQNAAISEEMASTASELSAQSEQMQNTVAFFQIGEERGRKNMPTHAKPVAIVPTPTPRKTPTQQAGTPETAQKTEIVMYMPRKSPNEDEHDADFERY